jgi:cell wall-associated NlpC family hydrolase
MQVAFLLCSQRLPRDASQQAQEGQPIAWSERRSGDLTFFNNDEGRIIHVGILKDERTILHAAGEVALDTLTEEGIWRDGKRTHALDFIRRMK